MFLLFHPYFHYELVREEFYSEDLKLYGQTVDRNILVLLIHVFHGSGNNIFSLVHHVVICHCIFAIGLGLLKELCLYPAGSDCHDLDAARLQFDIECSAVAQYKCFCRTVNTDIRNGLERRKRIELHYI